MHMKARALHRSHSLPAFTIIELAVVILIIGILSTLSFFAFNAWRDKVAEAEIQNDLKGVYSAMESAKNWSNGYPVLNAGTVFDGNDMTKSIFTQSSGVTITYHQGDGGSYCIDAVSKSRPKIAKFLNTEDNNKEPKDGTCAGGGLGVGELVVSTYAGSGTQGGIDGALLNAQFYIPNGIDFDSQGNMYISDTWNRKIRKVSTSGVVSTFATGFTYPRGIAVGPDDSIYVADQSGHRIRKISPAGVVTVFAGSGVAGYAEGTGTAAQFRSPSDIAIDAAGNVYVTDKDNYRLRKITPSGVVTTVASGFSLPQAITIDSTENLYITDGFNNAKSIKKITSSGTVTTVAGGLSGSSGLVMDNGGNFYVADCGKNQIVKVTSSGDASVFAGSGEAGFLDGPLDSAQFSCPEAVAIGPSGTLYISDSYNHRVRQVILR